MLLSKYKIVSTTLFQYSIDICFRPYRPVLIQIVIRSEVCTKFDGIPYNRVGIWEGALLYSHFQIFF